MPEKFDPYHEWLAIPLEEQPPNHYRLLSMKLFEESPSVIQNAADKQMAHLRTFQTGKHSALSQKLLNEVATAKVCLLNPAKRAAYDQRLRQKLQKASQPVDQPEADALDPTVAGLIETLRRDASPATEHEAKKPQPNPKVLIVAAAGLAVVVVGLAALWWAMGRGSAPSDGSLAKADLAASAKVDLAASAKASKEAATKPPESPETKAAPTAAAPPKEEPKADASAEKPKPEATEETKTAAKEEKIAETEKPSASKDATAEKPKPEEVEQSPTKKIDPPSADEQKRLIAAIDEVYRPGDAKDHAARAALARKLLEEGRKSEGNRAQQFVLLRRAGEIARDAGEADLMLETVDAIATAGFNIQPFPVKARLLKRLAEQGAEGGASHLSAIVASCVRFVEQAAARGAVEEASDVLDTLREPLAEHKKQAQKASRTARTAATRTRNPADKTAREKKAQEADEELEAINAAQSVLGECSKGVLQARHEHEAIQAAQERLKTQPDDPDTCLAVGRWHCFYKGDWDEGLKLLAKGSDEALKSLAAEELASKPSKAEDKVARGDAWWDLAEKATGKAKAAMRHRAGHWYQVALPDLAAGVAKSKVEKRLAQVPEGGTPEADGTSERSRPPLAVAPFDAQKAKEHQETWAKHLRVPLEMTNSIGMKLVLIPPGEFTMGDENGGNDEKPAHKVTITKAFYLAKYEVTQEEWAAVMGNNSSEFKGPKNPVDTVTWEDCQIFFKRLNEMAGAAQGSHRKKVKGKLGGVRGSYGLPTEAQWEYACRAGSTSGWCFGDSETGLGDYGWYATPERATHPVGQKKPNAWGLHDMHGNVGEWCADWYDKDYYKASPGSDPTGPPSGSYHVYRGGGWHCGAGYCRSAFRDSNGPGYHHDRPGFRACYVVLGQGPQN